MRRIPRVWPEIPAKDYIVKRVYEDAAAVLEMDWQTIADATLRLIPPPLAANIQLKHLDGEHWVATPL